MVLLWVPSQLTSGESLTPASQAVPGGQGCFPCTVEEVLGMSRSIGPEAEQYVRACQRWAVSCRRMMARPTEGGCNVGTDVV